MYSSSSKFFGKAQQNSFAAQSVQQSQSNNPIAKPKKKIFKQAEFGNAIIIKEKDYEDDNTLGGALDEDDEDGYGQDNFE